MSIIVDDNDPLVQYTSTSAGGWATHGKAGVEFRATTHSSTNPGDTAVLSFNGTSIQVFGTLGIGQGIINFSVDGQEPVVLSMLSGNRTAASHNQKFWDSGAIQEGLHNLTVTVVQDVPFPNSTFFLDYFVYATNDTESAPGRTMLFDDSVLEYSAGWQSQVPRGSLPQVQCDSCVEGTQTTANAAGASVGLSFEGSQVQLFGSLHKDAKISVDIDGAPAASGESTDKSQLFVSLPLPAGHHVMNITSQTPDAVDIDYVLVTPDRSDTADVPASAAATAAATSISTGLTPSITPSGSAAAQLGGAHTSNKVPIGAIVGGAVGGLFFLLLLLALLLWRRKARRFDQPNFDYPQMAAAPAWPVAKRMSVASVTPTLTEDAEDQAPKNFQKARPASRYIYYE